MSNTLNTTISLEDSNAQTASPSKDKETVIGSPTEPILSKDNAGDEISRKKRTAPNPVSRKCNPCLCCWYLVGMISAHTWLKLPSFLGILYLAIKNSVLLVNNIKDAPLLEEVVVCDTKGNDTTRKPDGTGNNKARCPVGGRGQPLGRNTYAVQHPDVQIDNPMPDLVAEKLLTRTLIKEANGLNLFVPAWIQFLIHDRKEASAI